MCSHFPSSNFLPFSFYIRETFDTLLFFFFFFFVPCSIFFFPLPSNRSLFLSTFPPRPIHFLPTPSNCPLCLCLRRRPSVFLSIPCFFRPLHHPFFPASPASPPRPFLSSSPLSQYPSPLILRLHRQRQTPKRSHTMS